MAELTWIIYPRNLDLFPLGRLNFKKFHKLVLTVQKISFQNITVTVK